MKLFFTYETVAPGVQICRSEQSRAYQSGKVYAAGGPKGTATQGGAAILNGFTFADALCAERFLAELVKRTGITDEATGLELNLLCSKRQTCNIWGHYNPFKPLAGRRVARIALYRWNIGSLVHEFAHHVDYVFQEGEGFTSLSGWHGPKFYEVLEELHAIAFEIMGTTEAAEYDKLQTLMNVEAATERALKEKFAESTEKMAASVRAIEERKEVLKAA